MRENNNSLDGGGLPFVFLSRLSASAENNAEARAVFFPSQVTVQNKKQPR